MTARMAPASAPFCDVIQGWLDKTTPAGRAPLTLFTTLARDERLFVKFFSGGLLDRGHLTLRQREIVIARTTALCRSEYEWGIHIAVFGHRAGFTEAQTYSLVHGMPTDDCWSAEEQALLQMCESLHREVSLDDGSWDSLARSFREEAILELLLLAGFYRTVSYLTNSLRLPLEPHAAKFPTRAVAL